MDAFKSPLMLVGRMLLALLFLLAGIDKLADIAGTAGYIASVGLPAATPLAVLSGVFEVLAAMALAVGWQARWAALSLALFTLLTNVLFHNYWALPDAEVYMAQIKFMKNLSIVGGMLVVAALGAGPLSLDARRASSP